MIKDTRMKNPKLGYIKNYEMDIKLIDGKKIVQMKPYKLENYYLEFLIK